MSELKLRRPNETPMASVKTPGCRWGL